MIVRPDVGPAAAQRLLHRRVTVNLGAVLSGHQLRLAKAAIKHEIAQELPTNIQIQESI
jgi:hypothetical protein